MENIYIKAMEFGFAKPQGFKYPELKNEIEKQLNIKLNQNAECGLAEWFIDSFTSVEFKGRNDFHNVLVDIRRNELTSNTLLRFNKSAWVIKGNTTKQYIDYLELKESRENSIKAFKISLFSIAIALVSIFITWYLSANAPQPPAPPFDVKIIEDKTSTMKLEMEVKDLKQELNKAEMLIEVFESQP